MSTKDEDMTGDMTTREMIFRFLVNYKKRYDGNTPSTREIAEACSVSISTANYHLTRLELENRIRVWGQRRRMIEIVGGAWGFDSKPSDDEANESQEKHDKSGNMPPGDNK